MSRGRASRFFRPLGDDMGDTDMADKVSVNIDTGNAAFEEAGTGREVARILRHLADQIEEWPGASPFKINLRDGNGNRVGFCEGR